MRWDDLNQSDNIEDRRGEQGGGGGLGGGFGMPGGAGGLGIGTVVVLGIVGWALGIDPRMLIGGAEILTGGGSSQVEQPYREPSGQQRRTGRPEDETGRFVSAVLGSTEVQWKDIFTQAGQRYTGAGAGHVQPPDQAALRRRRPGRHGAVLLPGRPEGLSRHVVLPRDRDALPRLRRQAPASSARPM